MAERHKLFGHVRGFMAFVVGLDFYISIQESSPTPHTDCPVTQPQFSLVEIAYVVRRRTLMDNS